MDKLDIFRLASSEPLSRVLPEVLAAARQIHADELGRWVRLEMAGYFADNPAMGEDTVVPEYRSVSGVHLDRYGRVIELGNDELKFLNVDRLRFGVGELEVLSAKGEMIRVDGSAGMSILRDEFGADPHAFSFGSTSVQGVLDAIRTTLIDKLEDYRDAISALGASSALFEPNASPSLFRRSLAMLGRHLTTVIVLVVAGLIVAFLAWRWGWTGP